MFVAVIIIVIVLTLLENSCDLEVNNEINYLKSQVKKLQEENDEIMIERQIIEKDYKSESEKRKILEDIYRELENSYKSVSTLTIIFSSVLIISLTMNIVFIYSFVFYGY